jgi:hypothetical protein
MSVKVSNLKTLVSPLSGCFQSSCYLTSILNSAYTAGLTTWLAVGSEAILGQGGLAELEAAYLASSSAAGTVALDALVTAIQASITNSNGTIPLVSARSVPLASSEDGTAYTSTLFNVADLTSVNAGGDLVYVEKLFVALNSGTQYLERIHVSDTLVIDVFVTLTQSAIPCTTDCGANPIPSPSIGVCGDDDSSSEDCGNRYGYNFPFFQPCASTASWTPL